MGRVDGKVAFITGAGRGQGRSHALRLAEEGADIIAVDICEDYGTVGYSMATEADLAETVKSVEALGRRIIGAKADVRDASHLKAVLDSGVEQLGRLDIVCANAAICSSQAWEDVTPELWRDTLDTNLTGVWNTLTAAIPYSGWRRFDDCDKFDWRHQRLAVRISVFGSKTRSRWSRPFVGQ